MPLLPIDDGDGAAPRAAARRDAAGSGSVRHDAPAGAGAHVGADAPPTEHAERIARAHASVRTILTGGVDAVPARAIDAGDVRLASVLCMTCWFHRFRSLPSEQKRIEECPVGYFGDEVLDPAALVAKVPGDARLDQVAREYVTQFLLPIETATAS